MLNDLKRKIFGIYTDDALVPFVTMQLEQLEPGMKLLDVGAGSQRFRKYCSHLQYSAQDFGESPTGIGMEKEEYKYGVIDIKSNCWEIPVPDGSFDAVLCTEVLEHVPYPEKTIQEIARILRPGGTLILTAPLSSLRHMDPYWYQPGLSDNWYRFFFQKYNIEICMLQNVGDYSQVLKAELIRTVGYNRWSALFLLPAIFYFRIFSSQLRKISSLTCIGYNIVARKGG